MHGRQPETMRAKVTTKAKPEVAASEGADRKEGEGTSGGLRRKRITTQAGDEEARTISTRGQQVPEGVEAVLNCCLT